MPIKFQAKLNSKAHFGQTAYTDVILLTLTLKMTTAQVVETSVTVNNNSPIQDYVHPDNHTQPTYEMTPGFKPFTVSLIRHLSRITPRVGPCLPLVTPFI